MAESRALRLDQALVVRGLSRSRTAAQRAIAAGTVRVGGVAASKPSQLVGADIELSVEDDGGWVSRAALKLLAAFEAFPVDPAGRVAADLGASTGGFTQVLLSRGAAHVFAIDVGHGQFRLDASDDRISLIEGLNVRDIDRSMLPQVPDLVTADLSFISLRHIFAPVRAAVAERSDWLMLVKPQFEVGKGGVKDGIVVDAVRRRDAVREVLLDAWGHGLGVRGLVESPVLGTHGNVEVLAWLRVDGDHPAEWTERINALG